MNKKLTNLRNLIVSNQSGQALLFVIVSLTIALAIVTSISIRNLSSTSRISQTDTSYRVTAVAEGGAERYLGLTDAQLDALTSDPTLSECRAAGTDANFDSSRGACVLNFNGTAGDNIDATAYVKIARHPSANTFDVKVKKDEVYELNLNGYSATSIQMLWKASTGSSHPAVYALGYGSSGNSPVVKTVYCPTSGCAPFTTIAGNAPGVGSSSDPNFNSMVTISWTGSLQGLRIRPVGYDAEVRFVAGASLPKQGYMIESTGQLSNNSNISATKLVSVFRSYNFLPSVFDFAIFTNGPAIN